ncbi:hypothetical protein HPB47_010496 [Ixodes persulcatus]|uniref:Uncharacterized protein n=1 Tax=Ixodes persulcatus TaxID=34615 RepID=A0AC60NYY1_IXOPE|nr:hypothetical protein HPB47_010496 [Ixodes persulcatus]
MESHGNYKFDYDVNDAHGNTQNRWETTDAHNVRKGGYSFTEPDGRFRQVQYEADGHGFRVLVRTNEPGTITHFPDHAAVIHEVPPVQGKQVSAAGLAPAPGHGVGLVQPPPLALKVSPDQFTAEVLSCNQFLLYSRYQSRSTQQCSKSQYLTTLMCTITFRFPMGFLLCHIKVRLRNYTKRLLRCTNYHLLTASHRRNWWLH